MNNVILGAGEVANAIKANLIEKNVHMYDKGQWEQLSLKHRFLHVAIPYSDKFIQIVQDAKKVFNPEFVVIHSTVKPGTSKKLKAVYSPVIGRHAHGLGNQLKAFRKFFAGVAVDAAAVMAQFDITTGYWERGTDSLEYAKIMSTTRMYFDLYFQKQIQKDCGKNGYEFEDVYTKWTRNYNKGTTVEHPEWSRPVYSFMETDFPGGHCLRPNIHLFDNKITQILREYEESINAD
jgi:hypothetical protein